MIQRGLQYLTIEMQCGVGVVEQFERGLGGDGALSQQDRKSTRLNSSHLVISYAVFCLKKKKIYIILHSIIAIHYLPLAAIIARHMPNPHTSGLADFHHLVIAHHPYIVTSAPPHHTGSA